MSLHDDHADTIAEELGDRADYRITVELRPGKMIRHGAGTDGNHGLAMRRPRMLANGEEAEFLAVSGASMKHKLRHAAVESLASIAGNEQWPEALYMLLADGGMLSSGGQSVDVETMEWWEYLFPVLGVFGYLEGNMSGQSKLTVHDVMPYCSELVDDGALSYPGLRHDTTTGQLMAEGSDGEWSPLFGEDVKPPEHYLFEGDQQNYSLDVRTSETAHLLDDADKLAMLTARQEAAKSRATGEPVKREKGDLKDNLSMPHSSEGIKAGSPMILRLDLHSATKTELLCLMTSLLRWIASGAQLGGGRRVGQGCCNARVASVQRVDFFGGSEPVEVESPEAMTTTTDETGSITKAMLDEYRRRIQQRMDGIEQEVATWKK